jgi:prophage antirepressor-like protein
MDNEIQVFQNDNFGEIRTVNYNGEPWFVAKDVCDILGVTNPTMSMDGLEDFERAKFNLGRQGEANIISESGFYTLVLRSRKAIAKPFRIWVTSVVLPQIRRTGGYIPTVVNATPLTDEQIMAQALIIAQRTIEDKNREIAKKD